MFQTHNKNYELSSFIISAVDVIKGTTDRRVKMTNELKQYNIWQTLQ